jgi:hypothetical protein
VGLCVGEDELVWMLFSISYILVSCYYHIVYSVLCFGEIVSLLISYM